MSKVKTTLRPTTLRLLLTLVLFGIVGLATTGFVLAQQKLGTYALEVSHKKVDAAGSKQSLQTLQAIERELAASADTVKKAAGIKHTSDLPQFKAIDDIRNHAQANGLSISNITFASANVGSTAIPATPAAPAAGGAVTPAATQGGDGIDISFTLGGGEVSTDSFVKFLYDVEHSTPKMQVQGINVAGGSDKAHVKIQTMTIKMFTK